MASDGTATALLATSGMTRARRKGLAALVPAKLDRPPRRLCAIAQLTDADRSRVSRQTADWLIAEGLAEPIGGDLLLPTFAGVEEAVYAGIRVSARVIDLDAAARALARRSAAA